MVCPIGQRLIESKEHLISNILTPPLIRLTKKCRCSDYCYANGPETKIATRYATLSSENGYHWGFNFVTFAFYNSHCAYIFCQSDHMKCQNVWN